MLATAAATFLLASTLSLASPLPPRRSASVVSLPARSSSDKVFNSALVKQDVARVRAKYSSDVKNRRILAAKARTEKPVKRSLHSTKLYDVKLHRRQDGGGSDGKESLTDVFDTIDEFYYGPLSIGTPAQQSSVDWDTGSSDLVIPLTECSGCAGELFDSSKSSTFKGSSTPFTIQYADQSGASGTVATDTVTVAGLTVANQGFGAVTNETGGFNHGPNAGLIGLGFQDNAESGAQPFFMGLASAGSLASNVFSFFLARGGADGSELCLGCINSDKYTGDIQYYPLDPSATQGKQLYWNIASTGLTYGGSSTGGGDGGSTGGGDGGNDGGDGGNDGGNDGGSDGGNDGGDGGNDGGDGGNDGGDGGSDGGDDGGNTGGDDGGNDGGNDGGDGGDGGDDGWPFGDGGLKRRAGSGFNAVIDSGTTLIYVAPDIAKAFYSQIEGSKPAGSDVGDGFYTYPCSTQLQQISIGFGSTQYPIDAKDFNLGPASQGGSDCVGGIVGDDIGSDLAIVGDEFMKNVYSVFDLDKKSVGFATAKH